MSDFTFKTTTTLPARRVADLMVTAIESPIGGWCLGCFLNAPDEKPFLTEENRWWYNTPEILTHADLKIRVLEDENDSGDKEEAKQHDIGRADIEAGLQLMAEKYPQHFADIINDNEDSITADVFLQCVVLKNVVYG